MKFRFKSGVKSALNFAARLITPPSRRAPDKIIEEEFGAIDKLCRDFTMTSQERMYGLYKAVEYVVRAGIQGDFVECGVWRGGSVMVIARTLLRLKVTDRKIYLYDTFEGMSKPAEHDEDIQGVSAESLWGKKEANLAADAPPWLCLAQQSEVELNLSSTGYPTENFVLVKGKVEETIPRHAPPKIALLRLDTDWYESTKHELEHLFPLLAKNGVLILDDYGYWRGSKKAVDEYFANKAILLNRLDDCGRIAIKTDE